ncbi:hypothetical protein [Enhydrobacter sp.]|jgi:hypothetical protein|uniref:hypothetical protein n=1 Tax=Enhydrobacter sp. TaxID=1894999 RepID=UPI002636FB42|nr:hypothetical protein [Enhydrobacter sp.]WIM13536.1 MAG: hypothetical protein OJF58_004504 [Enhydrobacter sp.]
MRLLRLVSPVSAVTALALTACAPAYEDGHLSRSINQQRAMRDTCLSNQARSLDDGHSAPETIARAASANCSGQNDRLIQLMATMDRSGEAQITNAVRKDSLVKATSYVLATRAQAGSGR